MKALLPARILAWTLALGMLALPLVGLFMGWFAADHWPVRSLRVDGPFQHVSAAEVRQLATPMLDSGFFATNPDRIRATVAALPWVAQVEVRKHWPDQVRIRFTEHQPFARWNANGLINRHGRVFRVPDAVELARLPALSGPAGSEHEVLAFYLEARKQLARVGLALRDIHESRRGTWLLTLDNDARVTIGTDHPQQRLARFVVGYAQLVGSHPLGFVSADLRYSNGFAVSWPQPEDTTGGPPPA